MIEEELTRNPLPGLQFIYCDLPLSHWWKRGLYGVHIHHYLWQIRAYFVTKKLHDKVGFDLVHHVTYVRYSSPSFLSLLPIPFIWGPVGGGEAAPKPFWQDFNFRAKLYEISRRIAHWLGEHDPFTGLTARYSFLVRATTEDTAKRLWQMGATNVEIFSESGLSDEEIDHLARCPLPAVPPIRFISMARLLHWKGLHLGLRAFARASLPDAEYWILGEGPEQRHLQILVQQLGIVNQVKFWGRLPRHETLLRLGECHVLIHPSLHDSGGWVCLEAMAAGRPVICLDLGGPAVQVTEETGFKIPAHLPEQTVAGLADAMMRLTREPELRASMGQAGQKRVCEMYSWRMKGLHLSQLYQNIIHQLECPS
jgi:glycosyltransferase involved in cell wall biosynthesis